jgi:tetratricopeptide (TPR) repeat protein
LARHCTEAGLDDKAVGYSLIAGQRAVARSAMAEAVRQLEKGLRLLAAMPSSPACQQQELDLLIALGPALVAMRGYSSAEVGQTFARASCLAEQLGLFDYVVPLFYGQFAYHLVRSEHRLALSFAEWLQQIGDARGGAVAMLLGRFWAAIVHYFLGEFPAASALFERCQELHEPLVRQTVSALTAEDGYPVLLAYSATTLAYLGHFDQARSRVDEAVLETHRLGNAHTLAQCSAFRCWVASICELPHQVRRYADEALDLANEQGFPFWAAWAMIYCGWSSAVIEHASDSVTLLTNGRSLLSASGSALSTAFNLALLAEAYACLGQPAEGLRRIREAVQFIEATDERYHEAEVYRVRGALLHATGDLTAAEQSYRRALAVAVRQSAKALELRAATSLARLWRNQGKRKEARELLAPVYGWFSEGFDTPVLKEAKALLDELAV